MTRTATLAALAAAAACLVAAGPATADSISYIRDGDVWLTTADGARQFRVTTTGGYSYASQADDGTFIALSGERLHRLDRFGRVLADFATPVSDGPPPPAPPAFDDTRTNYFNGPFEPEISPDGTRVAYTYFWQHYTYDYVGGFFRNRLESGTAITHADRLTAWSEFGGHLSGWREPSWVDADTIIRSNAGVPLAEDVVFNDIAPGGGGEVRRWFRNVRGYDRRDPELNRQGTLLALSGDGPADEGGPHLGVYRTVGGTDAAPEACFGIFDDDDRSKAPRGATWSPDGTRLAWQDTGGIRTLTVGDMTGGCRVPADDVRLIVPGGAAPDWGPADVPTARPATAGPGAGPRAGGGSATLRVAVPRVSRAAALRRGVVVRIAVPGAGTLRAVARAGGRVVARGTARVAGAGTRVMTVRPTTAGRRTLRGSRRPRLAMTVTFTPRSGATVTRTVRFTAR